VVEIEAKFRVSDHSGVRRRLEANGGSLVGRYVETNVILDSPDGALRSSGCGLRVRRMECVEGRPAGATLTFKGPREPGPLKRREELEVAVGDAAAVRAILERLGFKVVLEYEKNRERWSFGRCTVELDELAGVGRFVEIEGPDESAIRDVQAELGLGGLEHEPRSYVSLVLARGES